MGKWLLIKLSRFVGQIESAACVESIINVTFARRSLMHLPPLFAILCHAFKYALIVHIQGNQLVPELLLKLFDTLNKQ